MTILEQVQADARTALKAGERDRVTALRLLVSALQQEAKLGDADEVTVLQRERKKRLEAAEAYAEGGSVDRSAAERSEAELIEGYLPAQLSDAELADLVDAAVEESGAAEPREMGKVMSILIPRLEGRADGKRASAAVRERLAG
ncbi:MAG: GatB/YqeY domain-containing protein [Solirubrobacterales bacterium]